MDSQQQPRQTISHEQIEKAIANLDQRVITGIKIERWVAALVEFKNMFYCTAEELHKLRLTVAQPSQEMTEEDKVNQKILLDKLDLVESILTRLPLVMAHRIKPQPFIAKGD